LADADRSHEEIDILAFEAFLFPPFARPTCGDSGDRGHCRVSKRTGESKSYPGLQTAYELHKVRVSVAGLPETDFETEEVEACGSLVHCWVWRDTSPEDSLEDELGSEADQPGGNGKC
jgi:hypothetical protein